MITEDLIAYIQAQLRKNISVDVISSRLAKAGWHQEDIEQGIDKVLPKPKPAAPPPSSLSQTKPTGAPIIATVPAKSKEELHSLYTIEEFNQELPAHTQSQPIVKPENIPEKFSTTPEIHKATQAPIIPKANPLPRVIESTPQTSFAPPPSNLPISSEDMSLSSVAVHVPAPVPIIDKEEIIPALIPKVKEVSVAPIASPVVVSIPPSSPPTPATPSPLIVPTAEKVQITDVPKATESIISNLPKSAIIYSYARDFSSASKVNEVSFKKKAVFGGWVVTIIIILCIIASVTVAATLGYIKIPGSNFSFIKKDVKVVLANTPAALNALKSYKTETTVDIASPSFANITLGLVSGDKVVSKDKDSLSVTLKGMINHDIASRAFGYIATIKSSLLKDDIGTGLKSDGVTSYAFAPDLSSILGANVPQATTVSISIGEFDRILSEFSPTIRQKIKNADVYKILSKGIPPYVYQETESIFKSFLETVQISEKDSQVIQGVDTYHYLVHADRPATKKLLADIVDIFLPSTLSEAQKLSLDEGLGATTIDSFEVWVGKDDNMLHQYAFTLTTPLSRVIGLSDKGINGNDVTLSWKTTFYDFNVTNEITMPKDSVPISEFMKLIRDTRIKNTISSFGSLAQNVRNAQGTFGKKSNVLGSCIAPVSGSLFSPSGHTKGAATAIGTVASSINTFLDIAGESGYCYSTPNAWLLAAPLASNTELFFCADSAGALTTLAYAPKGSLCK